MEIRRLNPNWDCLLTSYQRELITKPGFGIVQQLPYLREEDVAEVMAIIEVCIQQVELMIKK
jgi:hypothetical protein